MMQYSSAPSPRPPVLLGNHDPEEPHLGHLRLELVGDLAADRIELVGDGEHFLHRELAGEGLQLALVIGEHR